MCDCSNTGLQITVIDSKLAEQNLLMFDQRLTVVGHYAWPLFLRTFPSVTYIMFYSIKVAYIYICMYWCIYFFLLNGTMFICIHLFSSLLFMFFYMSDHIFVLAKL